MFLLITPTVLCAHADEPLTVAVLPFDSADEKTRGQGAEVAELLSAHLGAKPELWLLQRADIDKILGEQTLALSGMASPDSAARVELRVEDAHGSLLAVDSETATSVHTAELVASKPAIQEAALRLLERIAPKLSDQSESLESSDHSD